MQKIRAFLLINSAPTPRTRESSVETEKMKILSINLAAITRDR